MPPPDQLLQDCLGKAREIFVEKFGEEPAWATRDRQALRDLLANKRDVTAVDFACRYRSFLGSDDPFEQKRRGSMKFFCEHYGEQFGLVEKPAPKSWTDLRNERNRHVLDGVFGGKSSVK